MKRSVILLWVFLALLAVYVEANERKNQKNFFDFWNNEKAGGVGDDLFIEGASGDKENNGGDDEDFDSIGESGDGSTNQNINLIDEDDEDSEAEEENVDDIVIKEDNSDKKGDNDDEDLFEGSGSGVIEVTEKPVNVKPLGEEKPVMPLSPCQNLRNSAFSVNQFIPECDDSGAFKKLQCYKGRKRCWCVNSNGVEIPGTDKEYPVEPDCDFGSNLKTCVFQLVQHSQGLLGAYKPTCTLDGLYEPVQCQGSECWCVDKLGNEVIGSIRNKPQIPTCDQSEMTTTEKTVDIVIPDVGNDGYDVKPNGDISNSIDVILDPIPIDDDDNEKTMQEQEEKTNSINDRESQYGHTASSQEYNIFTQPGLLAAIIGATVVGLLCIVLLVMFVVYRMRKKDEGSYPLEEQKYPSYQYTKAPEKEFYA